MCHDIETDVLVVGGGPAGAGAALTLRRYTSLRVVLLERTRYDQQRIGETVSPAIQPLLSYLGISEAFQAQGHAAAHGTAAAWGSAALRWHSFLLNGQGQGWHLDRRAFDAMLAQAVAESGGTLLTGHSLTGLQRDSNGASWRILVRRRGGAVQPVSARFLVDATGSGAAVAVRLGARRRCDDCLLGVVGFADLPGGSSRPRYTVIEAVPQGWWYTALLPCSGVVATYLTDAVMIRRRRLLDSSVWEAELEATQHVRAFTDGARFRPPLRIRAVRSSFIEPVCGPGWLAVGDAAASFDPLSSMGIGHAISSGIHGARAAHAYLGGKPELLDEYAAGVAENFSKYLDMRYRLYLQERRWPESSFWAARHVSPLAGPEPAISGPRASGSGF